MREKGWVWILSSVAAITSCGGRYSVGETTGGSGGEAGGTAMGNAAAGGSNAGGSSEVAGSPSPGQGGSMLVDSGSIVAPSRCGYLPYNNTTPSSMASSRVIWSRIFRFLNGASAATPIGLPTAPSVTWAGDQADAILTNYRIAGTPPVGLVSFLTNWLKVADAVAWDSTSYWALQLNASGATLGTLLTGATSDPKRHGIVTDQNLLTAYSTIDVRGAWMASQLYCQPVPPPPPSVTIVTPPQPMQTRRQALQAQLVSPACSACHQLIDPLGFSLENFDELGQYRDLDNGQPVDTSGAYRSSSRSFVFQGIDDLALQTSTSCDFTLCFTTAMLNYALMLDPSTGDAVTYSDAELAGVAYRFDNANLSISELIRAIVETPAFVR